MTDYGVPEPVPFRTATRSPEQALTLFGPEALADRLRAVQSVTDAALAHLKLEPLLAELLRRVRSLLSADAVRVLLCAPDQKNLTVRASLGLEEEGEEPVPVPIGLGVAGWVAHHRQGVIVDDISKVEVVSPLLRRLKSLIVAPLVVEGELLGVLKAGTLEARQFSEAELGLLQITADRVALAIDRSRQFEAAQQDLAQRRRREADLISSEQRLRDLNQRYESLLSNNPDAVFALDMEGRIASVNAAASRISGYAPDELLQMPLMPFIAADRLDAALDVFRLTLAGEPQTVELGITHKAGHRVELKVSTVPITVAGEVQGVYGIAADVTERKRSAAEQRRLLRELERERARLETLLRELPAGVLIAEAPSGRIILANERVEQVLRQRLPRIIGLEQYDDLHALHPNGRPVRPHEWPLARAIRDGEVVTGEQLVYIRGDGTRGWIRVNAAPIRDAGGEIVAGVMVLNDIDREKRSVETMRFLADVSSTLFASLDYRATLRQVAHLAVPRFADWCIVDLVDADGNPRQHEVAHQHPAKEELIRELRRSYGSADLAGNPLRQVLDTGEPLLYPEVPDELLRRITRDDEHFQRLRDLGLRSAIGVPLKSRERILGMITFATAESQRSYTEEDVVLAEEVARRSVIAIENAGLYEAAYAASQAKSNFLAVMSHELRTPLTAIMGFSELLLMGVPVNLPDEARRHVERIEAAAKHQLQLIEEILTFSRLAAGEESVEWGRVQLEVPVREAVAFVKPATERKGLELEVALEEVPVVESDAAKVRQILVNLLYNAIQFTVEGSIRVSMERDAGEVRLHVRDTGIGVAPDHLDKIFEPFWQVQQTSTREVGGTGLGLTVARRTARLLGGEITVESRVDIGTTFTLHLPLPPEPAEHP